jgi:hypothetical protein
MGRRAPLHERQSLTKAWLQIIDGEAEEMTEHVLAHAS